MTTTRLRQVVAATAFAAGLLAPIALVAAANDTAATTGKLGDGGRREATGRTGDGGFALAPGKTGDGGSS